MTNKLESICKDAKRIEHTKLYECLRKESCEYQLYFGNARYCRQHLLPDAGDDKE